ncbi:MAG: hypothetical protein ACOYA8_03620 [Clostridium sp.]
MQSKRPIYPEYRASEITLGGLHTKNRSIYQYFCEELQDENIDTLDVSGELLLTILSALA